MIKLYNFDELKPEEILNRDIRAEENVEDVGGRHHCRCPRPGRRGPAENTPSSSTVRSWITSEVTQEEMEEAFANMDGYFLETLREAAANIRGLPPPAGA